MHENGAFMLTCHSSASKMYGGGEHMLTQSWIWKS
jgi:hypothetical protein